MRLDPTGSLFVWNKKDQLWSVKHEALQHLREVERKEQTRARIRQMGRPTPEEVKKYPGPDYVPGPYKRDPETGEIVFDKEQAEAQKAYREAHKPDKGGKAPGTPAH
jgi:hypothetical protein